MTTTITQLDPATTNADVVDYLVTFSDPSPDLTASAFNLVASGLTGASITGVVPVPGSNDTQYTVTVATGTGDGTLKLIYDGGFQAGAADWNGRASGHECCDGRSQLRLLYPRTTADLGIDREPGREGLDTNRQAGFSLGSRARLTVRLPTYPDHPEAVHLGTDREPTRRGLDTDRQPGFFHGPRPCENSQLCVSRPGPPPERVFSSERGDPAPDRAL